MWSLLGSSPPLSALPLLHSVSQNKLKKYTRTKSKVSTVNPPPWGPSRGSPRPTALVEPRQDGDFGGHLLTICPAGSTCSPVWLGEEDAAEGGDTERQPGRLSTTGHAGRTGGSTLGPPHLPGLWGPSPGPPTPPPPQADALTVAAREAGEALGTRVAALPGEVGPAVAAAGQIFARPVREVRLAVAAWTGPRRRETAGPGPLGRPRGSRARPRPAGPPTAGRGPQRSREPETPDAPAPGRPHPGQPHSRRQAWGESRGWSGARKKPGRQRSQLMPVV